VLTPSLSHLVQHDYGIALLEGSLTAAKNPREGVNWLKRAAQCDHAESQYRLGLAHEQGTGVSVDAPFAADLYARAASQGHARAMYRLGRCHELGQGVARRDVQRAEEWYRASRTPEARVALAAIHLERGEEDLAFSEASHAAHEMYAPAMTLIGYLLEKGIGTRRDRTKAKDWLSRAAKMGETRAKEILKGIRREEGGDCVVM
jgi:TPR repeat protein